MANLTLFDLDEAIRQVTIDSAERGLILLRVRDETRMTVNAYEMLYWTGVRFGERKALEVKGRVEELEEKIKQQKEENARLKARFQDLKKELEFGERNSLEDKKAWTTCRADELMLVKRSNQQLKVHFQ